MRGVTITFANCAVCGVDRLRTRLALMARMAEERRGGPTVDSCDGVEHYPIWSTAVDRPYMEVSNYTSVRHIG